MADRDTDPSGGPRPIEYDEISRLRVDAKGRLTWDGNLVEVRKVFTLTRWQGLGTVLIVCGTVLQGAFALYQLGCALSFWVKGCPK